MDDKVQEASAIEQFALNVTVPLLYEVGDTAHLWASGTLFGVADSVFIITARHIFDKLPDLTRLVYPESPIGGGLRTLGSYNILKPKQEFVDVAAIELKSPETIARIRANWQLLTLENVASPSGAQAAGTFFLAGYPGSASSSDARWVRTPIITAFTKRMPYVPPEAEKPVDPRLDLFFEYGFDGTSLTGKIVKTPELPGTSGASVWEVRPVLNGLWTVEKATRVVGVQSGYIHGNYFRAKSWWAVALVLELANEAVADAVRAKLDPS